MKLRPLWVGISVAAFGIIADLLGKRNFLPDFTPGVASVCGVFVLVFYYMVCDRVARVLERQPDWVSSYTPAGVVWRQLIPFYGLYVLYTWLQEIEEFANARAGEGSSFGRVTFLAILVLSILGSIPDYGASLPFGLMTGCFYIVYPHLQDALRESAFCGPVPVRSGTLGIL